MAEIKVATDANFEELVLKAERPVVVDFWAAWCGPCKMVAPEMEKLAAKYDGAVDVVKVDVDANPRLSQAFNIMSIPTIAFFKPGAQPQGVVGFRPLEQLEQQFGLTRVHGGRSRLTSAEAPREPHSLVGDPGPSDRGRSIPGSARRRVPDREAEPGHGPVDGVVVEVGGLEADPAGSARRRRWCRASAPRPRRPRSSSWNSAEVADRGQDGDGPSARDVLGRAIGRRTPSRPRRRRPPTPRARPAASRPAASRTAAQVVRRARGSGRACCRRSSPCGPGA